MASLASVEVLDYCSAMNGVWRTLVDSLFAPRYLAQSVGEMIVAALPDVTYSNPETGVDVEMITYSVTIMYIVVNR